MRLFNLVRDEDASGISGTGVVAQGVEFDSGKVAMTWLSHLGVVAAYDNIKALEEVHGHGGKTRVRFHDAPDTNDVMRLIEALASLDTDNADAAALVRRAGELLGR